MKIISLFASAVILLATTSALASNYSFMNTGPLHYFEGTDSEMMATNADKALDSGANNQKFSWHNPKTGSWGYAIPSHSRTQDRVKCRDLKILNNARNVQDISNYNFCRINGHWKIVSRYH